MSTEDKNKTEQEDGNGVENYMCYFRQNDQEVALSEDIKGTVG